MSEFLGASWLFSLSRLIEHHIGTFYMSEQALNLRVGFIFLLSSLSIGGSLLCYTAVGLYK